MNGWSFEQWISLLAVIAAPLSGVLIAFIANKRANQAPAPAPAAPAPAQPVGPITEHQAHIAEISVIIDGFTASHRALSEDFERVRKESAECRETTEGLARRFRESERARRLERQLMVDHIEVLEALIPMPPGAPTRPVWGD